MYLHKQFEMTTSTKNCLQGRGDGEGAGGGEQGEDTRVAVN